MTLLAVPNVSEGRDEARLGRFVEAVAAEGAQVLDVHTDPVHNRSVLTLTGPRDELVAACAALAAAAAQIDLTEHEGVHPRLGGLDVCPFVPHNCGMEQAVEAARATAETIGTQVGLPVYLYGEASVRAETRELPDLRRGGLSGLPSRAVAGLSPDAGPSQIDPRRGVVCVGARGPLIAFNVWLQAGLHVARTIATAVRAPSLRALGLRMDEERSQVSMNLIHPGSVGVEDAFERVRAQASEVGAEIIATEIVGLVERRFMPGPDAPVARLLAEPDHCLEDRLAEQT